MWNVNGNNLAMTIGDFGLALPITISGGQLQPSQTTDFCE